MRQAILLLLIVSSVSGRRLLKPVDKKCGDCEGGCVGNCCSTTGECPSSSCPANGLGSNLQNCNDNTCVGWTCEKSYFDEECGGSNSHCLGKVDCDGCDFAGEVCFYDGVSGNFKVCGEEKKPVDCVLSEWGPWSVCSKGIQTRERTVKTQPKFGGKVCDTPLTEKKSCGNPLLNNSGCGPQLLIHNCKLDTTQEYTDCVLPNGLGTVRVPTVEGYVRMRFRINARGEYKPT
jgi:hypothetical protein